MVKRRVIEVIECPSDDLRSKSTSKSSKNPSNPPSSSSIPPNPSNLDPDDEKKYLKMGKSIKTGEDFSRMFKDVQKSGSQQFTGYARKLYKEDEYRKSTGASMKRQKVPRNILAGMIRKQGERSDKADKIARDAGIVQAKKKKVKKSFSEQNRRDNRISGPSPSIGFMRGGVLSVKKT